MPDVQKKRNQRWLPLTGSRYEITYISACIHNSNEIPTAIPMFSTLGNTIILLRRMLDVRQREKSKIAAEKYVISHLLPVTGSHLWFIPYPHIGHSSEYFSRVARPRKHGYSHRNFVSIVYISWEMCYFISTSGYRQPSLIYPLSVHRAFFGVLQSCCPTSKRWV